MKDTDKLVRQLSLVALLLSRNGQPVSRETIRHRVEGYPELTEAAFTRRFLDDRTELDALGIGVLCSHSDEGSDLFSLPGDSYYLPPIAFTAEELTALGTCLIVLSHRFPYSQPLRLALLSLAHGRPELLHDAQDAPPAMALAGAPEPGLLPKLQAAITKSKTVRFTYYAIGNDERSERSVDPYGLQLTAGEWYLVGRCHARNALRMFKLARITSKVTYATRKPHDFSPPNDFALGALRNRPAWQLAERRSRARIRVAPSLAWWVKAHWAHCGTVAVEEDGSLLYETDVAASRPLLSWVLGMAEEAELLEPLELRAQLAKHLRRLLEALNAPEASGEPAADELPPAPLRRPHDADWHVGVDRFTRLTALATYLIHACDEQGEAVLPIATVCADLESTAEKLLADIDLLNLVNFGGGDALFYITHDEDDRLHISSEPAGTHFARPAHLSPVQADTLLLAVNLVGKHLPISTGSALRTAAEKLHAARSASPYVDLSELLVPDESILTTVNRAIVERHPLAIEYWSEGAGRTSERTVEPYLLIRSRDEWYYVCWCRSAEATRVFRVATTKTARPLDELFSPRPEVELDVYRREGIPTAETYTPQAARVHYSAAVSRWIAERQPVSPLPDGSCVATQPYLDLQWLTRHLLRFAGEARPLTPPEAVADLRATATRLLALYTS